MIAPHLPPPTGKSYDPARLGYPVFKYVDSGTIRPGLQSSSLLIASVYCLMPVFLVGGGWIESF